VLTEKIEWKTKEEDLLVFKFIVASNCNSQGNIQRANHITPNLSKLIFLLRGCLIYEYHDETSQLELNDLLKFVKDGENNCVNLLLQERALLFSICKNEFVMPKITWTDDKMFTSLQIDGKQLTITLLKRVWKSLLKDLELEYSVKFKPVNNTIGGCHSKTM
jgi:hypothetical protein